MTRPVPKEARKKKAENSQRLWAATTAASKTEKITSPSRMVRASPSFWARRPPPKTPMATRPTEAEITPPAVASLME